MAKFDPTKPVQTRDGRPAEILRTDVHICDSPRTMIVMTKSPHGLGYCFGSRYTDGCIYKDQEHKDDLVNVPVKHTGWINIYPNYNHLGQLIPWVDRTLFKTKDIADCVAGSARIACVEITFETAHD